MLLIQTKREQSRLFKGFATLTVVWREHTTPCSHSGIAPPAVKRQRYKGVGGSVGKVFTAVSARKKWRGRASQ